MIILTNPIEISFSDLSKQYGIRVKWLSFFIFDKFYFIFYNLYNLYYPQGDVALG